MKLIKLSTDHYIIVDDSAIKEGDYCIDGYGNISQFANLSKFGLGYDKENIKKITHSTKPIEDYGTKELNDSVKTWLLIRYLDLSEVKELISEVDVEQYAWDNPVLSRKDVYTLFNEVFRDKTIEGAYRISASKQIYEFNTKLRELAKQKALEDNKDRKYTEENVLMILQKTARKYFKEGREYKGNMAIAGDPLHGLRSELREYIQSLQPKTEWEVEYDENGKLKLK
jgi:hypothetical protein